MKPRTLDPERITKPVRVPLDTSALALPKPGPREKSQPKDGRLIESRREYSETKRKMWDRQGRRCAKENCDVKGGRYLPTPAFGHRHHPEGRGLGGGKRNDSKTVLWCIRCHEKAHPGPQWSRRSEEE